MKLLKKVLSVAAVLALVVTAFPANARAASDVIDFEDGNMTGFGYNYTSDGVTLDGDPFVASVVDFNGSKQLKIDIQNDSIPKVVIDVIALVGGDNIDKVRKIDMDLTFANADEAKIVDWVGGALGANYGADGSLWYQDDTMQYSGGDWEKNVAEPIKAQLAFMDGFAFTNNAAGSKFLLQYWGTDKTNDMYIDNVRFYDADGNAIEIVATSAVAVEEATPAAAADVPKTGVVGLGLVYGLGALATGAFALRRKQK